MITAGVKIRVLRALLGKNQTEFADTVKISRATLGPIESGRLIPTDDVLAQVEERLGISLDDPRIEQFVSLKDTIDQPEPIAA